MTRVSVFRLSPLFLLAVTLVALAVFFTPGVPSAQAQERVWSARLTVKETLTGISYGCDDATSGKECSTAATLTDNTFTVGVVDYVIKAIDVTGGAFGLRLDKVIPASQLNTLVIYVGGDARLVGSDARRFASNRGFAWDGTGLSWSAGDVVGFAMQKERAPSTLRRVFLNVPIDPVNEGDDVDVTVTLVKPDASEPGTLGRAVTIPITLTAGTAESGDYGALTSITIPAGDTSAEGTISTAQDTDADDETFTVALGDLSSLTNVTSGPVASGQVRINDDETASVGGTLSVDTGWGNPECGSAMTASETPESALVLSPAPAAEEPTEYRVLADSNGRWLAAVPILTTGSSVFTSNNTFGGLREAYPGFTGFEYRLSDHPEVTARCTWTTGGI